VSLASGQCSGARIDRGIGGQTSARMPVNLNAGGARGHLGNDGGHPNRSGYPIMRRLLEQASLEARR
jgi:lysophospholipase L1-like esterase